MSKRSNQALINQIKDKIPFPPNYTYSNRNIPLIQSISETSKNKDNIKKENYKIKFSYIPKNNSRINITDNYSNNILDSKSNSKDYNKELNKDKESSFSKNYNNIEKRSHIISIFDPKKLLIKNNEKILSPKNYTNNYVFISNNRKNGNSNNKGHILIQNKNRILPQRYQLHLDSYTNNNSNSILIANKKNYYHYGNNKIIKLEEKYKKLLENKEKGRKITLDNISIINDKKKTLKK